MKKNKKINFVFAWMLILSVVFSANLFFVANAADDETTGEEVEEEEEKAEEAEKKEDKIDDYKDKLEEVEAEKTQLDQKKYVISSEIGQISKNITVVEDQIEESESRMKEMRDEIKAKEDEVEEKKEYIAGILMNINQLDREILLVSLSNGSGFEAYFSAVDSLEQFEEKLLMATEEVRQEKEALELKKKDQQKVYDEHSQQKNLLAQEKNKKSWILNETQQEINEKEATISEIQGKISELKADISVLLGKSYDTGEIKDAIKFASKQTGVRKGFLFGMLSIESGLATNVGNCNYKESRMNETRKAYFKEICEELDYDYKKQKVSCPPASYTGTGGAMGAAQFMSDTWMGYKNQISASTGHKPPDPWNLVDGVMAMALKLKNDGATGSDKIKITSPCDGKKIDVKPEIYASMKYLGWSCYALNTYGPRIQSLAGGYDKL